MVRKSSKIIYEFEGNWMDVKQIFDERKKIEAVQDVYC